MTTHLTRSVMGANSLLGGRTLVTVIRPGLACQVMLERWAAAGDEGRRVDSELTAAVTYCDTPDELRERLTAIEGVRRIVCVVAREDDAVSA